MTCLDKMRKLKRAEKALDSITNLSLDQQLMLDNAKLLVCRLSLLILQEDNKLTLLRQATQDISEVVDEVQT